MKSSKKQVSTTKAALSASTLLVAGALLLSGCSPADSDAQSNGLPNDGCTSVVVATSSEKVNLMNELSQRFKESPEHKALGECATVTAVNLASGDASNILSKNPKEWEDSRIPAPTLWSPASSVWTERVTSLAGNKLLTDATSFTKTPIVFGMPESMAKALGYPGKDVSIKDLEKLISSPEGWGSVGKPLWGSFKIAKTNPNSSTTGLSTILMQSYAASGKSKDLTVKDVTAAEKFSRSFEAGAIHYGDTTGMVLTNLAEKSSSDGSSYVSAIALEETSLYNYNIGNPDSHITQPGEQLTPPSEKLVAVYPKEGSLWSDNPAVVLNAPWVSGEQKEAGKAFLEFLKTKTAQEVLPKYGFRPVDSTVDVSGSLNASVGIDAKKPATTLQRPEASVVSTALDQWQKVRKPSAVLQLIDTSGSMTAKLKNGQTRLEAAVGSSQATINNIRPTDEIGVWAFTTGQASVIDGQSNEIIAEVRPFEELGANKENLRSDIGDLLHSKRGGTPLYDSVALAYDYMKKHAETGRINAIVVISDGEDTDSSTSISSLVQMINEDNNREGGNPKAVKIFAIGFSEDADMNSLEQLAKASGGQAFDATKDPERIGEVLQSVMNNF